MINLKPLNQYIRNKPFRMTTLKEVGQSIRQSDWSITIDLQDAFLHVPMHKDYRRFLRFSWNEKIYQFRRLPFGLTSSPQVFTDITTPLVEFCRVRGIRVIFYLDDILVLASSRTLLCQHRDFVLKLLLDVGFKRNIKKCRLTPSQVFPYLGLDWNTIEMQVSLPHSKLDQIRDMISVMEQTPTIKTRDCMVLLGKMNFAATAIPLARLHCRPLQFCLPRLTYDLSLSDSRMTLTQEARDSLRWWSSPLLNGRSLKIHLPTQVISTDASLTGWGAQMGQLSIHGLWTNTEKQNHINYLELKTVLFDLQHWLHQLKHQTVALQLDNTTAVAYLLKEGGTQSRSPHYLAAEILILASRNKIVLRPGYLPGQMNTQADALSRSKEPDEWMLALIVARRIFSTYGMPTVDLFASERSKQVPRYFTTDRRDPHALGTDALQQSWDFKNQLLYAFPPPA